VLEGDVKMECVWNCAGELLLASPVAGFVNQRHRKARQGVKAKKIEVLMINIRECVIAVKNDLAKLHLTIPVCTSKGEKVAPSR
jgi:translation initiation factor 2 gamma subunit (eIF-2gamma)